jgi:hypothetical protein
MMVSYVLSHFHSNDLLNFSLFVDANAMEFIHLKDHP